MMKDSILILSGGMDSVTLLYDYQDRIALALSFDYGSKHNAREIPFARLHCERLGIEHLRGRVVFLLASFEVFDHHGILCFEHHGPLRLFRSRSADSRVGSLFQQHLIVFVTVLV